MARFFIVMLNEALAVTLLVVPTFAQSHEAPSNEELILRADKRRDETLLRGLSKLRIGFASFSRDLTEDDSRKLIFRILARYKLPVEWTPTADTYKFDIPTLVFFPDVTRGACPAGPRVARTVVHLDLWAEVRLTRDTNIVWHLPVWSIEENADFDPLTDRAAMVDALEKLAKQFCLSYLSANR
jgi:hypothetical protein